MNAKANTTATNAPTAKEDNKAGNSKVLFVAVTEKEDNDYQDLHSRHLDLTDEEEARYMELAKKIRAAKSARKAKIDEVKSELRKMAFSIKDIFAAEDIKAAFQISDLFSQTEIDAAATKQASGKARKAQGEGATEGTTASKGELWIKIEGRGAPSYYKGQLYKKLTAKQKENKDYSKALGVAALPKNWMANDSIEALEKSFTPKAKELYEAKDKEFMAEMNDLVTAITKHKDYIAAKGTSGAGTEKQAA